MAVEASLVGGGYSGRIAGAGQAPLAAAVLCGVLVEDKFMFVGNSCFGRRHGLWQVLGGGGAGFVFMLCGGGSLEVWLLRCRCCWCWRSLGGIQLLGGQPVTKHGLACLFLMRDFFNALCGISLGQGIRAGNLGGGPR